MSKENTSQGTTANLAIIQENKTPKLAAEKLKIVFFVGHNSENTKGEFAKYVSDVDWGNQIQVIESPIENIDLDSLNLENRTDENTLYIVMSHGGNLSYLTDGKMVDYHYIDNKPTGNFFDELQSAVNRKIEAILFACHGGGVVKRDEIGEKISLLVRSSNKYTTLTNENQKQVFEILRLKMNGLTNQQIFSLILKKDTETFHFQSYKQEKSVKLARIGKFNIDEIDKLLKDSEIGFTAKEIDEITESFAEIIVNNGKKDFSFAGIEKLLRKNNLHPNSQTKFINKLKIQLQEKLSFDAVRNFIVTRGDKEFKESLPREVELDDDKIKSYISRLLIMSINRVDMDLIEAIVEKHEKDVIDRSISDYSPLMYTIANKHLTTPQIVKITEILSAKASLDFEFPSGNTILTNTIYQGNLEILRVLLKLGANPDLEDKTGISPLMIAIQKNKSEAVKMLLKANADPNLVSGKLLPLNFAITEDRPEIFEILKQNPKTDLNAVDAFGDTPLMTAIRYGKTEYVEKLVSTSLVDLNQTDRDGKTVLEIAKAVKLPTPSIKILTDAGAKENKNQELKAEARPSVKSNTTKPKEGILTKIGNVFRTNSLPVSNTKEYLVNEDLALPKKIIEKEKPDSSPKPTDGTKQEKPTEISH